MTQPSMTAVMGLEDQSRFAPQPAAPMAYNPSMAMYGQQMAGAPVMTMPPGAAPYPLYGVPHGLGADEPVPFYRRGWFLLAVGFVTGGSAVGYLWWKFGRSKP